jgi:hypothetical protein
MEVSRAAFGEIKQKLIDAAYDHALLDDGATLDMQGIALVEKKDDCNHRDRGAENCADAGADRSDPRSR